MRTKWVASLVALALALPLAGCGEAESPAPIARAAEQPAKGSAGGDVDPRVVDASNGLGFRLLSELASSTSEANLLVSPLSVSAALAMTREGAAGKTRDAMTRTLGLDGLTDADVRQGYANLLATVATGDGVTLDIADALFADKGVTFNEGFLARNSDFYAAKITTLDLNAPEAPGAINAWVSERTQGRIPKLVDKLDPDAVLELLNAVYFKGAWAHAFDPHLTRDASFTPAGGAPVSVRMMSAPTTMYPHLRNETLEAAEIPYRGGRYGLLVILPSEKTGLEAVRKQLTAEGWRRLASELRPLRGRIDIPKIELDSDADLVPPLSALGMRQAFAPGADFSAMFAVQPKAPPEITQARHRAAASMDESGTEAAAGTQVEASVKSAIPMFNYFQMVLDRPFLFAIRDDKTGAVLFLGQVGKPK